MASADFCEPFEIPHKVPSPDHGQAHRPPRVRVAAFTPHPPHLLRHPLMATGFARSRKLARVPQPPMRFVSLGSELCFRLPPDPASRRTPLPSASSFRHQDLQGTSTPKPLLMPGTRHLPPAKPEAWLWPLKAAKTWVHHGDAEPTEIVPGLSFAGRRRQTIRPLPLRGQSPCTHQPATEGGADSSLAAVSRPGKR
jgi:hypothetical protein